MTEFRYAGVAMRLAVLALLPVCAGFAQDVVDEDSLFAKEELTINEAVQGALPDVGGSGDDFLNTLLADEGAKAPAAVPAELPLDLDAATPAKDTGIVQAPAAVADLPVGEALPQNLDAVVDGIAAEPAVDINAFPLDAGFDANAVVGEMLEGGEADAAVEPAVVDVKPVPGAAGATAAAEVDLDMILGEMVAEEKPGAVAAPVAEAPVVAAAEPVAEAPVVAVAEPVAEAPVVAAAEPVADPEKKDAAVAEGANAPLDFLFGEAPAVAPVPVATDSSLNSVVSEQPVEAEGNVAAVNPAQPEPVPVVPAAVKEPVDMPVEIAAEPPPAAEADPLALDDDIFKELASEARVEMRQAPEGQKSVQQASEVAADPFAGLSGDLAGEAGLGVKPAASSSSASVPAATPAVVSAAGDKWVALDGAEPASSSTPANAVVADPSVQGAKAGEKASPAGIVAFEEAERLKRGAQEYHARSTLSSAEKAMRVRDYPKAIRLFEESRRYMPKRPDTESALAQVRKGLGDAYYEQALSLERMADYENAKLSAQSAVRNGDQRGEEAVKRIQGKMDTPPPPEVPVAKYRWKEEAYKSVQLQINSWMKQGREAYLTGEYEKAILAFESVLARDPENKEAIRLIKSASNKQFDRSTMELNATASRMMATVRDTWNPRQYGLHEAPIRDDGRMVTDRQEDELQRMAIVAKMGMIRIPEVDFRQANIRDVVNFLFQQSAEFDPDPLPANRKGVNIILKLESDAPGARTAPAAPADPFSAAPAADAGGLGGGGANETLVTFSARDISLKEALDIVVDIAGLKYLIRGNVVMVMPRDAAVGEIEHRMYDVLPSAITRLQELSTAVGGGQAGGAQRGAGDFLALEGSGGAGGEDMDLKSFFTEMGVDWPTRSSIKFVRGLGKLVVANTIENLTVFEKVLSILNVVPYQIEIESRFIEVAQTDVDSLGLEWILNDNWELAQKKNSAGVPLATRERIEMNANAGKGGFTAGNRFLTGAGIAGATGGTIVDEVARLSGVLTNPELTMVLHALQQRGHTDLLSAPKITTQSGQQAVIKVVTEYIYPTEFEVSGIGGDAGGGAAGGGGGAGGGAVGAVVTPREFTTREVGVILEVLPEVSPEGQMINLTLSPEVVSEPEWKNYGSTYTSYDPNGNQIVQTLNMEQPFFHTRKLKTNLLIYNGATVVMGGMITEVRENVDDKIPLLGDIPLLGRLFRSRYESSQKRNLLIFVTARLVDPAGRALDKDRFTVDKGIAERIAVGGGGGEAAPAVK